MCHPVLMATRESGWIYGWLIVSKLEPKGLFCHNEKDQQETAEDNNGNKKTINPVEMAERPQIAIQFGIMAGLEGWELGSYKDGKGH